MDDAYSSQSVRRALSPLAAVADRTGAAVVCLGHVTKSDDRRALYRALGSVGIVGAARSALMLAADPEDPDARVLAPTKANLSRSATSLRLKLVSVDVPEIGEVARVEWLGEAATSADWLDKRSKQGNQGADRFVRDDELVLAAVANHAGGPWRQIRAATPISWARAAAARNRLLASGAIRADAHGRMVLGASGAGTSSTTSTGAPASVPVPGPIRHQHQHHPVPIVPDGASTADPAGTDVQPLGELLELWALADAEES